MPPEACQATRGKAAHGLAYSADVRTAERAVALDVGAQHVAQARRAAKRRDGVPQRKRVCLAPAARCSRGAPAVIEPHVEGEADRARRRSRASQARDFVRPLDRGAADDDAGDARAEQLVDDRGRARMPPPTCRCVTALWRGERGDDRAVGELPSRAPSRSTMCSQRAPRSR